ncbi:Transmembrane_domain-containing protein [Hexamita inflata]|uniref:Transmembrane domain-containing protein n=2 Tax=Hexamita inflata TaxID=28002 RepID=A0AA86QSX4_9EUKA|nr:Transmembrane domain-containing protein [Hexamita inflata]
MPTTRTNYIFWFIDVFKQPLSVYATRGNLTTIYVVFQYLILTLYAIMALISVTILIPVYYYGTDTSWNSSYLTSWSLLSIAHLENNSIMLLIPITIICVFTYYAMFIYEQFTIIYAFFRQKCMKRVIPENYVVLLQNLPIDIDTKEKLENVLSNISNGIKQIVPIPRQSQKLSQHLDKLKRHLANLKTAQFMMDDFKANEEYRTAILNNIPQNQYVQRLIATQKAEKMQKKEMNQLKKLDNSIIKIRELYFDIVKIQVQDNIEIDHLNSIVTIPPSLPDIIMPAFDYLKDQTQMVPNVRYPSSKYLYNIQQLHIQQQQSVIQQCTKQIENHPIGRAAFLICESQSVAAEKYTTLITQNSLHPQAMLAPNSREIVWHNVATDNKKRKLALFWYYFWLIILFIAYLYGQTQLNKQLIDTSTHLYKQIFDALNFSNCVFGRIQSSNLCSMLDSFAHFLPTFINSFINAFLMALLPQFLKLIVKLQRYPSISQANDKLFNLNFTFLIFILGIIQVAVPNLVNRSNGVIDFTFFEDFSITSLFEDLGKNIINLQFTFITYIITNYFTSPAFSLLNIYYLLSATIYRLGLTNYLEYNVKLRFITFNFPKQLAYLAHMLVLGYIFAIVSPITNVIIFITYIMMVTIDRYVILYVRIPDVSADLSAQSNMLVNVIGAIFIGLFFMLFSTCCYFFVQQSDLSYFGIVICIASLIYAITKKISVDKAFKRALTEMTRGKYDETVGVKLNPAHIDSIYTEDDNYLSRYDLNNEEQRKRIFADIPSIVKKAGRARKHGVLEVSSMYVEEQAAPLVVDEIKDIKGCVRQSVFDRLLKHVYIDLTDLPVSTIRFDDIQDDEGERVCTLLQPEHIRTVGFGPDCQLDLVLNQINLLNDSSEQVFQSSRAPKASRIQNQTCQFEEKLSQSDFKNVAAHYTHPSLQLALNGQKIINQ